MWGMHFKEEKHAVRKRLQTKLDRIALAAFDSVYNLSQPTLPLTPLVISSPHSGRHYPKDFLAQSNLSLAQLRQSEDSYIDKIIAPLSGYGVPMITALFPRIYVDLNRGADEWPPECISLRDGSTAITPRARAGLGVVPTRSQPDQNIYPHDISPNLIRQRLDALYHPYHHALSELLKTTKQALGRALLLDCHSMPGQDATGSARADIVLGTDHGDSCHPETITFVEKVFTALGYSVMLNYPYAGGFITRHYGQPDTGVEAIQIEINKDLYLNAATLEPHAGMKQLTENMRVAVLQIIDYLDTPNSLAAE